MSALSIIRVLLVAVLLSAFANAGRADELARLYADLLKQPANIELNLRYAAAVEAAGEPRRAIAAYERVLDLDPNNAEARQGLMRARRKLQPDLTQIFAEFGGAWESNPHRTPIGRARELEAVARLVVRDDRALGDVRWRSNASLYGEYHSRNGELTYGYAGGETGPVIDLSPDLAVHAAVGGGGAYFSHRTFYSEGIASLQFERGQVGASTQTLRLRGGYRVYNDFFPTSEGFFADAVLRSVHVGVLSEVDTLVLSPWVRWSGIDGIGFAVVSAEEIVPGRYWETGAKAEYYWKVLHWLSLGANGSINWREYDELNFFVRRDRLLVPGATAIIHQPFGVGTDLRFDYRFEHNHSNDPSQPYRNHSVVVALAVRR